MQRRKCGYAVFAKLCNGEDVYPSIQVWICTVLCSGFGGIRGINDHSRPFGDEGTSQ